MNGPAGSQQLWRNERAALLRRRRAAGLRKTAAQLDPRRAERPNDAVRSLPVVGLALSGGGVRSATFCLGVLRGMAQRGLLARIDYLSTVSGGGYVGAMFGRLVQAVGIARAQQLLADGRSPVLEWLRRNGRYLTPAGARDLGVAAVTYLRAFVAVHGELMVHCLLLGVLVTAPHLWQYSSDWLDAAAWEPWGTLWWALALAWLALGVPGAMAGYWMAREGPDPAQRSEGPQPRDLLFTAFVAGVTVTLTWRAFAGRLAPPLSQGLTWVPFALMGLWSLLVGSCITLVTLRGTGERRGLAVARLRNGFTRALYRVFIIGAALAGLGALDRISWWMLELVSADRDWLWSGLGLGGVAVLVLRGLAQSAQQLVAQPPGLLRHWGRLLLQVGGVGAFVAVLCFWLVIVQALQFTLQPFDALTRVPATWRAAVLLAACLAWLALTAGNESMANASSLHSFYRARLTRAYLSVGNLRRPVLGPRSGASAAGNVRRVVPDDDVDVRKYRPERRGGPIHLVNCCLNQTRDDQSGLYNADRKGTLVTVLHDALEIGPGERIPFDDPANATQRGLRAEPGVGTLGRWVAVSGAATSPGAGAYTSRGWALLLFLLGVRLGHWTHAPQAVAGSRWQRWLWSHATKPVMLLSEASATFFGRARPWWYLSDGGHFENTGVYALLKRRADFIVAVDCGADPRYEFNDIENLVRKARIDLDAEIEFYPRDEAARRFTLAGSDVSVLSPEDMIDNLSARGVMLARVRYNRSDTAQAPRYGSLLVIKPALHAALDVDLLAYAARHAAFPHESTADQFFDEAQWESYHCLGEDIGESLHDYWLAQLPGWQQPHHGRVSHAPTTPARLRTPKPDPRPDGREPMWRRTAKATAIGTTLGLGASGTLLVSLWQIAEQVRQNESTQRTELRSMFTDVSKEVSALKGGCPGLLPDHVAMEVKLLREIRRRPSLKPIERESLSDLLDRMGDQCRQPACSDDAGDQHVCDLLAAPSTDTGALSYWHPFRIDRTMLTMGELWSRVERNLALTRATVVPGPARPATPASQPQPSQAAWQDCGAPGEPVRVYINIYDEASRESANELARQLQSAGVNEAAPANARRDVRVQVAGIENVTRSAELRQQRRPTPWPRPTLVLHHRRLDGNCAKTLAGVIGRAIGGDSDAGVWISELPRSLSGEARPHVLELWLPPAGAADSTGI
jgi:predicted acylesterase/phospholipase RssA